MRIQRHWINPYTIHCYFPFPDANLENDLPCATISHQPARHISQPTKQRSGRHQFFCLISFHFLTQVMIVPHPCGEAPADTDAQRGAPLLPRFRDGASGQNYPIRKRRSSRSASDHGRPWSGSVNFRECSRGERDTHGSPMDSPYEVASEWV